MSRSYGFVEITGVVAALDALDIMCKTAGVELASWERKLGGRLVTIIIEGDVAAVTEAVNAAVEKGIKKPASYAVIARPHEEIVRIVELSASRWRKEPAEMADPADPAPAARQEKEPLVPEPAQEPEPVEPSSSAAQENAAPQSADSVPEGSGGLKKSRTSSRKKNKDS